ncbi:MAG: hypothetical protein K1Y36_11780 [Blastocatellia bacterium]|nr:hypothetical protein [Blastocatellia bacterium]
MLLHLNRSRYALVLLSTCFLFQTLINPIFADTQRNGTNPRQKMRRTPQGHSVPVRKNSRGPVKPPTQEREGGEFEADIEARDRWFWFERAYPFDSIPEDARRRAWEARPRTRFSPQVTQQWVPIGPKPTFSGFYSNWGETSGRINVLAISPENSQIVLVGGATGGVWRSADGGRQFTPVTDDQIDLAVNTIVFSPSNPSIVYAGMGDKPGRRYLGSGVLKSTDAGQTWKRVSNTTLPAPGQMARIVVDPANPDRVYAAQYTYTRPTDSVSVASGFYLSTDGGVNWRKTLNGLPFDLDRDPANSQTLFLSLARVDGVQGASPGLYKSTDGGETWANVYRSPYTSMYNMQLAIAPSNTRRMYLLTGGFTGQSNDYRLETSNDGGQSWTPRNLTGLIDTGQFSYNNYLMVEPTNPDVLFAGTRDIFKSLDAGKTWENLTRNFDLQGGYDPNRFGATSHPDQHSFAFDPKNPNRILVGNDGGLSLSENSGKTFVSLNQTLTLTMFVSLAAHPTNAGIVYGGTQDNGTQRRQGSAGIWQEFASGDGGNCVIDPVDPTKVYTTYVYTSVYRFGSNGDRFERTIGTSSVFGEPSDSPRVAFYPPFTGNGVNSNLYFGTWRLFISTDQGNTWNVPGGNLDLTKGVSQTTGTDVLNAIGVSRSNPSVIFTGSVQGRVMATNDAGRNWRDVTPGLPNRTIRSLVIHPTKPETVYMTVSGFGTGHVFRTTDSGGTWNDISGNLPNIPTNTLLLDPANENTIYVGTDIGVFRSITGGVTWETFNQGLPPVLVSALVARKDGSILAATYGRGAYELKTIETDDIAPAVNVITPNGGEDLPAASQTTVKWTSTDNVAVVSQNLDLSTDGGSSFTPLAGGLAGNVQEFSINLPIVKETTPARIRVSALDAAGNRGSDTSDGDFMITASSVKDTTPPTVRVLAPNGGEKLKVGSTVQLTWQSSDDVQLARHDIALSTDGGATYPFIVAAGLPGTAQSFAYVVPTFSGKTKAVRIRVMATDAAGNSTSDASDGNFKIK